jgi:hypothetical protein
MSRRYEHNAAPSVRRTRAADAAATVVVGMKRGGAAGGKGGLMGRRGGMRRGDGGHERGHEGTDRLAHRRSKRGKKRLVAATATAAAAVIAAATAAAAAAALCFAATHNADGVAAPIAAAEEHVHLSRGAKEE